MSDHFEARYVPRKYIIDKEMWPIPYLWRIRLDPTIQAFEARSAFNNRRWEIKMAKEWKLPDRKITILARSYPHDRRKFGIYQLNSGNPDEIEQFHRRDRILGELMNSKNPAVLSLVPSLLDQYAPLVPGVVMEGLFTSLIRHAVLNQSISPDLVRDLRMERDYLQQRSPSELGRTG